MVIDGVADVLPSGVKHEGRSIEALGIDRVGLAISYVLSQFAHLSQLAVWS